MNASQYSTIIRVIATALAAVIAVAIVLELPLYIPLLAIMVALVISSILRRQVREIMADERNQRIQERAMSWSYRVYTIAGAAVSLIAIMLRSRFPDWAGIAGETLAYSICALMLIHLAFSYYFSKKL